MLGKNRKDPSAVAAEFFVSYFKQTDDWHDLVVNNTDHRRFVDEINEAYAHSYGRPDTMSITISPEKCMLEEKTEKEANGLWRNYHCSKMLSLIRIGLDWK